MLDVLLSVTTQHDWRMLAVALVACALASVATFFLYAKSTAGDGRRIVWLTLIGLVGGSAIWTTHFLAIIAYEPRLPQFYEPVGALGSFAVAVAAATLAFAIASGRGAGEWRYPRRAAGGLVLGAGIAAMHFIGMAAYRTIGQIGWRPGYVAASVVIGALLSIGALAVASPGMSRRRQAVSVGLFMAAICGMHFTAMTGAVLTLDPGSVLPPLFLSEPAMAVLAAALNLSITAAGVGVGVFDVMSHNRELNRLRDALDAMPDGLALFDDQDRLVAWNSRYAALRQGLPLYRGQSYLEITVSGLEANFFVDPTVDKEAWLAERIRVRRSGGSIDVRGPGGSWLRCSDRRTADGGVITQFTDITDLKRAEEAMAEARDLAKEASRIKSEFLANMNHEIRTPMNGILGMNALMLMSDLDPAQRRYAQMVQNSAEGLMAIFNNILDVARLEAGAVEMASVEFDLGELLVAMEADNRPGAHARGLALTLSFDGRDWRRLRGDPVRLRQVLNHLVENAVKFTDKGEITVWAESLPQQDGRSAIRIEVADTGSGVAPETKAVLFEPFRQGEAGLARRHGGAGLGLGICRHAVRLMGGSIGVIDRQGGGSIFWIEISLPSVGRAVAAAAKDQALSIRSAKRSNR
jgi:signal transduction histidine kinase/NO-binding membrane sensor protein with MHYT domain